MKFSDYFPMWDKLKKDEQELLLENVVFKRAKKKDIIHSGSLDCIGLILIASGQLRAYMLSEEGREISLFRMFEMDMCLFSASCMMPDIQFDVYISAEKDTEFWVIPPKIYKEIVDKNIEISKFTNQLLSSHFSDVMWLLEQIMWKSMDKRLGEFLLEEISIEGENKIMITHENIANHLGTAREVITRMLRYFQSEGFVKLSRGGIEVVDKNKLEKFIEK